MGGEAAGLVLGSKPARATRELDVFSECLGALLSADPGNLPLVVGYLERRTHPHARPPHARRQTVRRCRGLDPLKTCVEACPTPALRNEVLLAIAILRAPTPSTSPN
ncbi:MAG: hypothetical protein U0835_13440 [Isosphaeraceae bacterium]